MATRLSAHSISLPQLLLSHDRFLVPAHQRVYAWPEILVDRLFGDFGVRRGAKDQATIKADRDTWLFLGTIYLSRCDDGRGVEIGDGQQRIVTATMIYAAARDLESDPVRRQALARLVTAELPAGQGGVPRFRVILRDVDADFFSQWVQKDGATLQPFAPTAKVADPDDEGERGGGEDFVSIDRLPESQRHIIVNRDLIVDRLMELGAEGRQQLVQLLETASEVIVITAANADDARNAHASTYRRGLKQSESDKLKTEIIGAITGDERDEIANHWDECEAAIGKDALEDLLELLVLIETGKRPGHDLQTDLFAAFKLPQAARAFVKYRFAPASDIYRQILAGKCDAAAGRSRAAALLRGRSNRIDGHLIGLMRMTHELWQAPAVVALGWWRDERVTLESILAGLERLAAVLMINGADSDQMRQRYAAVAQAMNRGVAAANVELEPNAEMLAAARERLSSDSFANKARFRMPVLLKLNDLAAGEVVRIDPKSVSVEHILPKNAHRNSTWRVVFRDGRRRTIDWQYLHRLGNLTILNHKDNRDAGNNDFDVKRPILRASDYALAQAAGAFREWTPAVIEAREADLLAGLFATWKL